MSAGETMTPTDAELRRLRARVAELEAERDHYRFALEEISRVEHWSIDRGPKERAARALREAALVGAAPDQEDEQ